MRLATYFDPRKHHRRRPTVFAPVNNTNGLEKNSSIKQIVPIIEVISSAYCTGMLETHRRPESISG